MAFLLRATEAPPESAAVTRLGGRPVAPVGIVWPPCARCERPKGFVAQFRLRQLLGPSGRDGILLLFQCSSGCRPSSVGVSQLVAASAEHAMLLFAPGSVAIAPIRGLKPEPFKFGNLPGEEQLTLYRRTLHAARGELVGQFGRWPVGIQRSADPECSCGTSAPMRFVAQLEENAETGIGFGAKGTAFLFQCGLCARADVVFEGE